MSDKPRVAILGGGVGAMSAAYWLSQPGWREHFESITVYQLGFRLGGKGASGRNADDRQRIEEHGLHVWLGFYENAFRMMDACYRELGRTTGPIRTVEDAFEQSDTIVAQEWTGSEWENWVVDFPPNNERPWEGGRPLPSLWEYFVRSLGLAREYLRSLTRFPDPSLAGAGIRIGGADESVGGDHALRIVAGPQSEGTVITRIRRLGSVLERDLVLVADLAMAEAIELAEFIGDEVQRHDPSHHDRLLQLIRKAARAIQRWLYPEIEANDVARRAWHLTDVMLACAHGIIAERLLFAKDGLDAIDDVEFIDWLVRNGAARESAFCAPIKAALYDMAFAYRDGDGDKPCGSAGQALRGLFRLFFTNRGAINWKMRAGMGDIVFGPLYEVLHERGVRFEFFHRVDGLSLSPDKRRIAAIDISVQAQLRQPKTGYDPLVRVKGLPCWPAQPRSDQLTKPITAFDAESFWSEHKPAETKRLELGKDFDVVVLGISIGSLRFLCADLMDASPKWRRMIERVATVETQAIQIWLREDPVDLGWEWESGATSGFVEPFDSSADMRQTLERERAGANGVLYFCNCLPTPTDAPDPVDATYPARRSEEVRRNGVRFLSHDVGVLLPHAMLRYPDDFRWEVLVDPKNRVGAARFDAQFWRANVDPSERYVQSLPGTTKYRLSPHDSGFENLYLAGDWTHTGLDVGCVESAAVSGMLVAHALRGAPALDEITGYGAA